MKVSNKRIMLNWIYILIIMIVGFIAIGALLIISGNIMTVKSSESFYDFNLNEKKEQLNIEIDNRIDEINRRREHILLDEKKVLYNNIHHLYNHLLQENLSDITDDDERKKIFLQHFEDEVSKDSNYLYFALSTEGALLRSGTDEKIVGVNLYDTQDKDGVYYIREITKAKQEEDGLYVDYYWPKIADGESLKKTSYCLYLPEFDIIVGTGAYHEDIQEILKNEIYESLQSYYEDKENYIFVTEYDSTARVSVSRDNIGKKMSAATDFDGNSIHNLFMSAIEDSDDGYIRYQYIKRDDDTLTTKISYIHDLDEWGAYIGMGFYIDDLNQEVDQFVSLFKKHYYNEVLYIVIGLILLSIIIYAFFQRGAHMQNLLMRQGDLIYEKLFSLSDDGIVVISSKGNILYKNDIINKIFHNRIDEFIEDNKLKLIEINDNIYSFTTDIDRQYIVTLRKENVTFRGKESLIYFVKDITLSYMKSNSLEEYAYNDELTGLLNRRALSDDFVDIRYKLGDSESFVLGILDIDKFKIVNDTHGHIVGDEVLKILSNIFVKRLRQNDKIYRYGGEEFVVVLQDIDLMLGKKILIDIDKLFCNLVEEILGFKCTYSAGIVNIDSQNIDQPLSAHISNADKLLYKAKHNGRNRIEIE